MIGLSRTINTDAETPLLVHCLLVSWLKKYFYTVSGVPGDRQSDDPYQTYIPTEANTR